MIKFSVRGVEKLQAFFKQLPADARKIAVPAVATYLIGNDEHGLSHYVGYKYVSRASAYGKTFSSDKQRRYVMARIREGSIAPGAPHRSGTLKRGWTYSLQGGGFGAKVYNPVHYAGYVMGDGSQANQPRLVGWRTMMAVVNTNIKGAIKAAERKIQEWINGNS